MDHPIAQENFAQLAGLGYRFIGPESGWLACRNVGSGRLSDPAKIVDEITRMLTVPGLLAVAGDGNAGRGGRG